MKLATSYNLFDTEELIKASIIWIRNQVDYINIVYQTTSNTGKKCSEELLPILNKLFTEGFIDKLIKHTPNLKLATHLKEINKRNIGLRNAKLKSCTHFRSLDSNEFYNEQQLIEAKKIIIENKFDYTAVRLTNYFKKSIYKMIYKNQPEYFVSFIFKIKPFVKFKPNPNFPVIVHSTGQTKGKKFFLFNKEAIEMHHMTLVRKNINSKLKNSSSNHIYKKNNIDNYVDYFNNWKLGQKVYPPSNYSNFVEIEKVKNQFNISI
jgi:hypothetical protein